MNPIIGGLITGGASLLGSFMNSTTSAANTQQQIAAQQQMLGQTEQFNAQQTQQQEQFQETMSNTAYQRASADMQKAGLNPMMMFGSGGAASTPSGGAASVGTPSVPMPQNRNPLAGLGEAVSSGVDAMVKGKYVDKMSQEIGNMQVEADKSKAITDNLRQSHDINAPQARDSLIRMGYPDWLANTLVYTNDVSKSVGNVGSAIWDLLPSSLFKGAAGRWGGASSSGGSDKAFTPSQNSRIYDMIQESGGTSAKSPSRSNPMEMMDMKKNLDAFMRKEYGGYLGGRNPGTGGSFD